MNFYPHHIGDYRAATAHLSNEEDLAYRRLLEMYYDTEQPIPLGTDWVSRRLRVGTQALETVLMDFFEQREDGWHQVRCDREVAEYARKADIARVNGKLGGRRKSLNPNEKNPAGTKPVSHGYPEVTQALANQEPVTKNHEPVTSNQNNSVPDGTGVKTPAELTKAELWATGKSLLASQGMPAAQCGTFVGKLVKDYGDQIVIEAVRATCLTQPADAAEYLKAACLRAAGRRGPLRGRSMTEEEIKAENDRTTAEAARILFGNSQEIIDV